MSAVITEQLVQVAQAARSVGHGGKTRLYENACKALGISKATLHRKLKELTVTTPRKRRSDAGKTSLTREEAKMVSALLMESARKNEKRLYSIPDVLKTLRANGQIRAEYMDATTGEIRLLSESAVSRAMYTYGVHPEQLMAPAPVTPLASKYPNHVWQIDASLCVLYYLKTDSKQAGLRVMDHAEFYKNKPKNLARIASDRVWSYEITDHASGWIYVEYVMGAESGENLCSVLINAMQERGNGDVMHGRPEILMCDPGAANTSAMTRNLCHALGIRLLVHKAKNARVTGQVENARNIIERKFEPGLKFQPVNSLEELNELARRWRIYFNGTAKHSRTGYTRTDVWLRIRETELVNVPSVEICRELAVIQPENRKVLPALEVSFEGKAYDVSAVPGIMVGEKVLVTKNPWRKDAVQVVAFDADGQETFFVCPEIQHNDLGWRTDAAIIGETYKCRADTPAQTAIKEIELLVTGTDTPEAAEAARKAKQLPFGGKIDPYKHIDDTPVPTYLPKRGTAHELALKVVTPNLSVVELAKQAKARMGENWTPDKFGILQQLYPDGASAEELDAIVARLGMTLMRAAGGMK